MRSPLYLYQAVNVPLVGSSKNRIEGLVTSSQAIDTLRFSPPEMPRLPVVKRKNTVRGRLANVHLLESPMRMSRMPKIPSSFIVSNVRYFFAAVLISRGNLRSAEYSTVS